MNEITETKKPRTLKGLLSEENVKAQFALALPKHLNADRFARVAITALTRTPKLQECTPESFMKCLLDLSAMGLEPDGRVAHLIPYGKDCTLIVDYKGLVDIVRRDANVLDVQCFVIRENDDCEWENGTIRHKINPLKQRGEAVGTYTQIKWKNGTTSTGEPFSKDDAEHAKKSSKTANNGPWKDHYVEMWKKSNIKRDAKMWPLSAEIRDLVNKDDGDYKDVRNVTPTITKTELVNPFGQQAEIETIEAQVEEEAQ